MRADQISVTAKAGWAENEVAARVVGEEFIGALVNLRLETAAGTESALIGRVPDSECVTIQ